MAKRDLTGAVNFAYLKSFALSDTEVIEQVLSLFCEQAGLWTRLLTAPDGWRDAVHTIKGAARGIGADALGEACAQAEQGGLEQLHAVHAALDAALSDIAAYRHEKAFEWLKR